MKAPKLPPAKNKYNHISHPHDKGLSIKSFTIVGILFDLYVKKRYGYKQANNINNTIMKETQNVLQNPRTTIW